MPTRCSEKGSLRRTARALSGARGGPACAARPERAVLTGLVLLASLAALAACAGTPGAPPGRAACLAELVHAYDVAGMVNRSQSQSLEEAHRAIERAESQYAEQLPRLTAAQRGRFEAATDRFVTAARATPDAVAAEAVWARSYAAD